LLFNYSEFAIGGWLLSCERLLCNNDDGNAPELTNYNILFDCYCVAAGAVLMPKIH